jgi:hypothetical protein
VHVPLRHPQLAVTGEFLDRFDGRSPHREVRAERVPQDVYAVLGDTCAPLGLEDSVLDHLPCERLSAVLAQHARPA